MIEQHRNAVIKVWLTAAQPSEQKLRSISQAAKTIDLSGFFPVVSIISQAPIPATASVYFLSTTYFLFPFDKAGIFLIIEIIVNNHSSIHNNFMISTVPY